jgi:hypothetical protein
MGLLVMAPGAISASPPLSPTLTTAAHLGEALLERQGEEGLFADPPALAPWRSGPFLDAWRWTLHARSCSALFRLFEATGDPRFRDAAERGLWHLATALEAPAEGGEGRRVGHRLDTTAETLLAALEWLRVTGDTADPAQLEVALAAPRALGLYLLSRQDRDPDSKTRGAFDLATPYPLPRAPGLATLALARLADLDPQCRGEAPCPWREGAEAGAGWMMAVRDIGKNFDQLPRDAPSLLALDALHRANPEAGNSYFLHARRMGEGILRTAPPRNHLEAAERARALAAVASISRRSGADDAERFTAGAREALQALEGQPPRRETLDLLVRWLQGLLDREALSAL